MLVLINYQEHAERSVNRRILPSGGYLLEQIFSQSRFYGGYRQYNIVKISLGLQKADRKEFLMEIKKIVAFFQKSNNELKQMADGLSVQEMKYLRSRLSDFSGLLYEAEQKNLKAKEEERQGQRGKTLPCCFLK